MSNESMSEKKTPQLFSSGLLLALPLGLVLTLALYLLLYGLHLVIQRQGGAIAIVDYVYALFLKRGMIPYILTLGFFTGLSLLLIRLPWILREKPEITNFLRHCDGISEIDDEVLDGIGDGVTPLEQKGFLFATRIRNVLDRARTAVDGAEMDSGLHQISDFERDQIAASHTTVRYLIWLIPTLGFIGTVLGISQAVYGFGSVIGESSEFSQVSGNLVEICRDLGVAFETTLLALVFSALLAAVMAVIDRMELSLSSSLDELCVTVLRPRLSMIINQRARLQHALPITSMHHAAEGSAPREPHPSAARSMPGTPSGSTILLQVRDNDKIDLVEASKQSIQAAMVSLAEDGQAAARALSDGGSAARLHQFLEGNLYRLESLHQWIQNDSIRRDDLTELSKGFHETARALAGLIRSLSQQSAQTQECLERTMATLTRLEEDGVKARVSITSTVTPQ